MHPTAQWLAGPGRAHTRFGQVPRFREGLYRLGASSYAWMVPNGTWGETNLGLVQCGRRSVLIDTAWDLPFTHELLHAARELLARAPIEAVINTHSDGDHCWGNQLFADKLILGTQRCSARFAHLRPGSLRALRFATHWLGRLHVAGLDDLSVYVDSMFAPYDFRKIALTRPNLSFEGEYVLPWGPELLVHEVGPAHTDGDAIVHVPADRVVFTGDLLFVGVTPVMWAGPVENMVVGLRRLLALEADSFVPGHGPFATRRDVQDVIDYWQLVHEGVSRCQRMGMQPAEAAAAVIASAPFQRHACARWECPERLVTSAHTMYRNWGQPASRLPGVLRDLSVLRQQARLAACL